MQLVACDIETSCGVKDCEGYGLSNSSKCEHALHHRLNKIDIIGVFDGQSYTQYRDVSAFDRNVLHVPGTGLVGHGFKFDYKTLKAKGSVIQPRHIVGDTHLLATCVAEKIPASWLAEYNEKRKELNASLPPKQRHRVGTPFTLKALAPYYLGVPEFWENPLSHDDVGYNRKDCEYTYRLHEKLVGLAEQDKTLEFYKSYLLPWQKLLAEAEYEGVLVNELLLHEMYGQACKELKRLEAGVHSLVGECFGGYRDSLAAELAADSAAKCQKYIETRLKNKDKAPGVVERYAASLKEKIDALPNEFNLNSSQQMLHILSWAGIDTTVEKRDKETNEWIEKEGTDKFVLKRAKVIEGNQFAAKILEYRNKETEVSYLKQYIGQVVDGRIYCTFSITGTRTGRLSSSGPNLQNVKGALRAPFIVADPGKYLVYTVDSSQIEPRVIAYLTQDAEMVRLFQDGRDYHNYATKKFFDEEMPEVKATPEAEIKTKFKHLRNDVAKHGDLSIIYGTGAFTFQTMCLVRGDKYFPYEKCKSWVDNFRAGMKGPMGWKKRLEEQYKNGTKIYDKFGYLVQARDSQSVHMTLFNTYVQGMASRMIFHASLMAFREFCRLGIDAKPLIWVHDECVWRFPKGRAEECKKIVDKWMTSFKLETQHGRVPLGVEGNLSACWEK